MPVLLVWQVREWSLERKSKKGSHRGFLKVHVKFDQILGWLLICACAGDTPRVLAENNQKKQNKTKQMEAEKYWEILAVSHLRAHRIWNFIPVKLTVCLKRNALLFKRKIKEFRFFYNIPSTMLSIKGIFLKPTKLANKQENVTYSQKKESQ